MQKLYKKSQEALLYQEAWVEGGLLYHHWGQIGETGEHTANAVKKGASKSKLIAGALKKAREDGYSPIDDDDRAVLQIEFKVVGFGTEADFDKRQKLQNRMNETLGWVGIGHCDGGSSGSGTMEVCCYVVDYDIARRVVESDLKGTEFDDYLRIYREDT